MITIGICDDDINILSQLKKLIESQYKDVDIKLFEEPMKFEEYMLNSSENTIDIMIMDIFFETDNGIQVAKRIQKRYPTLPLIYLTGYIDYARDIFESDPIYFLVKPIESGKLYDAINRAIEKCDTKKYMVLKSRGEVHRIYHDDVIYIESEKKSLHIHTNKSAITCISKMSDMESKMPEEFIRIHQSFLVNANYIDVFDSTKVKLNIGKELPISRYRGKNVKEKILRYIGKKI